MKGYDYLIVVAVIMFLLIHSMTLFVVSSRVSSAESVEQAEKVFVVIEQNPLAAFAFSMGKLSSLFSVVFYPSIMLSLWFVARRVWNPGESTLWFTAYFVFFSALNNFINDLAVFMGVLASGGI